jgi:hypothetical protein
LILSQLVELTLRDARCALGASNLRTRGIPGGICLQSCANEAGASNEAEWYD